MLRAENLQRRYGGRTVVDVAELEVAAGEVLSVLGPNGSGKSTLFRLLLLLERPDAGRILLNGRAVGKGDADALRRMSGVFQQPYLFDATVRENVAFGLRARGVPAALRAERVDEVLSLLGIEALARRHARSLSVGEAQRVALGRALAPEPELLVLDEPTANLDVTIRRRFRSDLERVVRSEAKAALLITHDPTDAFLLADRIAVLEDGRIVQQGTPEQIVLQPASVFVAAMTGAELLLNGAVCGIEDELVLVRLGGGATMMALGAGAAAVGERVHVSYRPEDVVLADATDAGLSSAVNRYELEVAAVVPTGGLVRVRLRGELELTARVTRHSADVLRLEPGRRIVAQLKASALHVLPMT